MWHFPLFSHRKAREVAPQLERSSFPTPPVATSWISLAAPGRYYPLITYAATQSLNGRGNIGLINGEDGLVYHFAPDAVDRVGRPDMDDVAEIWIVLKSPEEH